MVVSETGTLGRNVKVSLLKMVLISADPLSVAVITVFTGTSVAASLGMTSRGPGRRSNVVDREGERLGGGTSSRHLDGEGGSCRRRRGAAENASRGQGKPRGKRSG